MLPRVLFLLRCWESAVLLVQVTFVGQVVSTLGEDSRRFWFCAVCLQVAYLSEAVSTLSISSLVTDEF